MRADGAKELLENDVHRALGEAASELGIGNGRGRRRLDGATRVNDKLCDAPESLEPAFDERCGGDDALVLSLPSACARQRGLVRSGFPTTHERLRFVGRSLARGVQLGSGRGAWRFPHGHVDFS